MDFHVAAGSYERLLYGLDGRISAHDDEHSLTPAYMYPAHITCIKTLALAPSGALLATGATDEHVKIYDLRKRKETGTLMHHNGSITALHFHANTHLLTASEDSNIAIIRTSDWEVLSTLTGHSGAVVGLDVHPTGRMALSVGVDGTLRVWDLTKGNCAITVRLKKKDNSNNNTLQHAATSSALLSVAEQPISVLWSSSGDHYCVLTSKDVTVWNTESGEVVSTIPGSRLNAMATASHRDKELVIVGGEDGCVRVWSMADGKCLAAWNTGHGARVKSMSSVRLLRNDGRWLLATCSTNGRIAVWDVAACVEAHPFAAGAASSVSLASMTLATGVPLSSYDAKCRLTCIAITGPIKGKTADDNFENEASLDGAVDAMEDDVDDDNDTAATKAAKTKTVVTGGQRVTISYDDDDLMKTEGAVAEGAPRKRRLSRKELREQRQAKAAAAAATATTASLDDGAKKRKSDSTDAPVASKKAKVDKKVSAPAVNGKKRDTKPENVGSANGGGSEGEPRPPLKGILKKTAPSRATAAFAAAPSPASSKVVGAVGAGKWAVSTANSNTSTSARLGGKDGPSSAFSKKTDAAARDRNKSKDGTTSKKKKKKA